MSITSSEFLPFPVIMGATASGKTALAIEIARKLSGEIISADSMQVYRGLDIGTAKPTPEERKEIPHHLIDIADLSERFDVFRFADEAEKCLTAIRARGRLPIAAGGSGLYLRALLYGLDPMPSDPVLRAEIDRQFDNDEHYPELCSVMEKKDPEDLARFSSNRRKLLRAWEVFQLSGQPMVRLQERWKKTPARPDARSFVLVWEPAVLKQRIKDRCHAMLKAGWIEEAEHFLHAGLNRAPTAWQALGYREIAAYLAGTVSRSDLPDRIATATWQFARRQNTWFRTQHPEALRIPMPSPAAETIIRKIMEK